MRTFDLVVIGGGAAGEKGAVQAAYFGKKVCLIEKEPVLGGAMVNTGTLPSKTLRETALHLSGFRQRGLHGLELTLPRAMTVHDLLYRLDAVVTQEHQRLGGNLQRHGVEVLHGKARFVDSHTIEVSGHSSAQLRGEKILIATGSAPHRPSTFPFECERVYDSDEIVRVKELPRRLVIVGGGVIGAEYASLFAALGTQVTIVEAKSCILGFLDDDLVAALQERLGRLGVQLVFNRTVASCQNDASQVVLTLSGGERLEADGVLVCAGREANTAELGLAAAGLKAGKRGQLEVNERFQTSVPHIAAVGDVIGFPALASTSMEQARVAVVHFFDLKYKERVAELFPYGIFTIPEVSMVGETEAQLKARGIDYVVGRATFDGNARGVMIGERGFLKLLFRRDDLRLLGVHVIGEGATELIHIGLTAMMTEATAHLFIRMCFNYPTLSEAYKYAAYDALGKPEVRR